MFCFGNPGGPLDSCVLVHVKLAFESQVKIMSDGSNLYSLRITWR